MGSDIERSSVSEDQTSVNIRERAGRRKQKPVRVPDSRSKRIWCFFGIPVTRPERPRGLEGRYRLTLEECQHVGLQACLGARVLVRACAPGTVWPNTFTSHRYLYVRGGEAEAPPPSEKCVRYCAR